MVHRLRSEEILSGGLPGSGHPITYTDTDRRIVRFYEWARDVGWITRTSSNPANRDPVSYKVDAVARFISALDDQPRWIVQLDDWIGAMDDAELVNDLVIAMGDLAFHGARSVAVLRVIPTADWWHP